MFSLSYEQLTRFAEQRIRECNLDSQGVIYLCESAKAGAVLSFWHELVTNGYASMNAIKRQALIDADHTYQACRGDFVVCLDGSTCLQLWNKEGRVVRREGDPLEVAQWLQACHDAGMEVRVQVNESVTP